MFIKNLCTNEFVLFRRICDFAFAGTSKAAEETFQAIFRSLLQMPKISAQDLQDVLTSVASHMLWGWEMWVCILFALNYVELQGTPHELIHWFVLAVISSASWVCACTGLLILIQNWSKLQNILGILHSIIYCCFFVWTSKQRFRQGTSFANWEVLDD